MEPYESEGQADPRKEEAFSMLDLQAKPSEVAERLNLDPKVLASWIQSRSETPAPKRKYTASASFIPWKRLIISECHSGAGLDVTILSEGFVEVRCKTCKALVKTVTAEVGKNKWEERLTSIRYRPKMWCVTKEAYLALVCNTLELLGYPDTDTHLFQLFFQIPRSNQFDIVQARSGLDDDFLFKVWLEVDRIRKNDLGGKIPAEIDKDDEELGACATE